MPNRLASETSLYLRAHAGNPVDWYPWGEEAFARAGAERKPVLLSIGYSACHWCHMMSRQCFDNQDVARLMNERFVNVIVDREERPDLDFLYMEAVQALTGAGGWPLTVFLRQDRRPFYGGTYYAPEDRQDAPGFPRVLESVSELYRLQPDMVDKAVEQLTILLGRDVAGQAPGAPLSFDIMSQACDAIKGAFDSDHGGFGAAPKFPQPSLLEFLLRYYHRSRRATALEMAALTLEKMACGGIYDQVGGGFHRYSTDAKWLVPHFEKMLCDSALLARAYVHAYLLTGRKLFRSVARETLDYLIREMLAPEGGFCSSQDSDTEGEEGKYYLWTPGEIGEVLGPARAKSLCKYFGVTEQGDFNGASVLHISGDPARTPGNIRLAKRALLERRLKRVQPARDDKILASWNGLAISSLSEAGCTLGRKEYLAAASAAGEFLLRHMIGEDGLRHVYAGGQAKVGGFLQDYALVIDGFLDLHQATFRGKWLSRAIKLCDDMVARFWSEGDGSFFDAGTGQEDLFLRPRARIDGSVPSGSSAATFVLFKLARLADRPGFQEIAVRSLKSMQRPLTQTPLALSNWLCALDFCLSEPLKVSILGPRNSPEALDLLHALYVVWQPNKVVAAGDPDDPTRISSLRQLDGKEMISGRATAHVCDDHGCKAPAMDGESLRTQLLGANLV